MPTRRRQRRTRTPARGPLRLHILTYVFDRDKDGFQREAIILIRSRHGQAVAMREGWKRASELGRGLCLADIHTVPPPRATPALDGLTRKHTAFASFLDLLTAPGGYSPSIRLDRAGPEGRALARAYDAMQTRWGDPRRALVWPASSPRGGRHE